MKVWLATQHLHTNEQLMDGVNVWLYNLAATLCDDWLQKLVSCYSKCVIVDGDCVEKLCSCVCV